MKKRNDRFIIVKQFYGGFSAGLMAKEVVEQNFKLMGMYLTEAEVKAFLEKNIEIPADNFNKFLAEFDLVKVSAVKKETHNITYLNTPEKAKELGVKEEDLPTYLALIEQMQEMKKQLQKIVPNGIVGIAIPLKKVKATEPTENANVGEGQLAEVNPVEPEVAPV